MLSGARWTFSRSAQLARKPALSWHGGARFPLAQSRPMLDKARADQFADALALDEIVACPLCLLELAWEIRDGKSPHWQTVARTASWVWPELRESLLSVVVEARMRELPYAEDALRDLREREDQSPLARAVVLRLAGVMADELTHTSDD